MSGAADHQHSSFIILITSRDVEYEGEGEDGERVEEVLHRVVALREAHREVALHRHRDRRPHGARQRDLDHGQPIGGQPRPAMARKGLRENVKDIITRGVSSKLVYY